jgi:hypothetical protein
VTAADRRRLALLAAAAVVAYSPALYLPFFDDDYPLITEAQVYGSPGGLGTLLGTTLFRFRATSFWLVNAMWDVFGLAPAIYHSISLLLHVVNTWLVYRVAWEWPEMRPGAFWAALFFAVQEGHQEAVMWFAAINEPLMFLFGMGALLCWLKARAHPRPIALECAGVALYGLALLSKESAVVFPALLFLAAPREWRRLAPYAALAALAVVSAAATRDTSFRFTDGSFSVAAPFWITWPKNIARVLWIWGWVSLLIRPFGGAKLRALVWIGIALAPYSFLTYSSEIPSRQTYLASAGLVFLFGLAMARIPRRWLTAAVAILLIHNIGYLWIRKRAQILERAAPTEQLIRLARETNGPIWVRCFPTNRYIAREAVRLGAGRSPDDLVWTAEEAVRRNAQVQFCYKR